jgi:hypothetical protein
MIRAPIVMALALGLSACSSTSSSADRDAGPGVASGEGGATVADGGGVCCPVANDVCSGGPAGGWAPSAAQCTGLIGPDGYHSVETDSHGCTVIEQPGRRTDCCGCPIPRDAAADDSPDDASRDGATD